MVRLTYENRLKELGYSLPEPPKPVASYVPSVRVGKLLFVSGVLPLVNDRPLYTGKLGREVTLEQGYEAAKVAALNALSIIKSSLGSLEKVRRVVRLVGYVASAEGFNEQPKVVNGASDLLIQVFGEKGKHSRVAVGVMELPRGAPVEIEMIVQTK
ncbi:MAG: RidA family protein [Thaumarchaeota archaeon]|nr:RidA family protein [Candidatus Terraquivivens yellowstonensis]MCL7387915.1 RidA family protein [Candidatus Terraquivivens yellowstonensis]MCL7393077.1 RidA family protein [Candidatus Terraquivivens yellowstonensis]MCL7395583.1 RidA family protein [Candidatus Terraquivivens yellowstonensis]MCL7398596.1 RidA family protein [Candidatus Terraquivivens yellowstonensis]